MMKNLRTPGLAVFSWGELKQQPEESGRPFPSHINCRYTAPSQRVSYTNCPPCSPQIQGDVHPFLSPEEKQLKEEETLPF